MCHLFIHLEWIAVLPGKEWEEPGTSSKHTEIDEKEFWLQLPFDWYRKKWVAKWFRKIALNARYNLNRFQIRTLDQNSILSFYYTSVCSAWLHDVLCIQKYILLCFRHGSLPMALQTLENYRTHLQGHKGTSIVEMKKIVLKKGDF